MTSRLNPELPIDKAEDECLELKSLAALDEPDKIARGVVAMLNSQGGELWIGIKEGRGKSNEVEPMPEVDATQRRQRLQDHLLDAITPTPMAGEVSLAAVPVFRGPPERQERVLRVTLRPVPARRPYAFRRHGGWHFLRRVDNRVVQMSRDEIGGAFSPEPQALAPGSTGAKLQADIAAVLGRPTGRLWLGIEPEKPGDLNLRELRSMELLVDPTLSGTPRDSYNFALAAYGSSARIDSSGDNAALMIGKDALSLRVSRSGGVRFEAALAETFWVGRVPFVEAEQLLSPERLLGYLISVVRLVRRLLAEGPRLWRDRPRGDLSAVLAVTGLRGWGLLPGNLIEWPSFRYQVHRFEDQDQLLTEPLRFSQEDLEQRPDECGMRLVERIYDAFKIDQLPSIGAAALGQVGLPAIGPDGYSRWVGLDLGRLDPKVARLRRDPVRPDRFYWETREGDQIPASGRWVHGWTDLR